MHLNDNSPDPFSFQISCQRLTIGIVQVFLQPIAQLGGLADVEITGFIAKDVDARTVRDQFRFVGDLRRGKGEDLLLPVHDSRHKFRLQAS